MFGPRLKLVGPDRYSLRLSSDERDLLHALALQLKDLLAQPDNPTLKRLFPPAYLDDPKKEREYRRLVGDDLVASRQAALDSLINTASATELNQQQVNEWLGALHQLRLELGTRLDVHEEEPLPDTPLHALYEYLTGLEFLVVEALAAEFD